MKPDKTFVPYEGHAPSKRQAKRLRKLNSQQAAREAKRNAVPTTIRLMSGLDRKAEALGIYSEEFHMLSRSERSLLVHKATLSKLAA